MAIKGPDIHIDHGWPYSYQLDALPNTVLTGRTVTLRVGTPCPTGSGAVLEPLFEHVATVTGARTAIGTVPEADTAHAPGEYAYNADDGVSGLIVEGRAFIHPAVPRASA